MIGVYVVVNGSVAPTIATPQQYLLATAYEDGHCLLQAGFGVFDSRPQAQTEADRRNLAQGLTLDQAAQLDAVSKQRSAERRAAARKAGWHY